MESNQIITYVLGAAIIGYGAFMFVKSIKKQVRGDCGGCSYDEGNNCKCSSLTKK